MRTAAVRCFVFHSFPGDPSCACPPKLAVAAAVAVIFAHSAFGSTEPTFAATSDTLKTTTSPSGGTIVSGTFAGASSPQSAAAALLSRIHAVFGSRPTVVQGVQNAAQHSLTLLFTDRRAGKPYTGIAIVNAAPGSKASGIALFDTSARFPKTVKSLLATVQSGTAPEALGAAAPRLDPAERLSKFTFPDNSGSISVPADWTVKEASGGGAGVVGPHPGEVVLFDTSEGFDDPSYGIGAAIMNHQGPGMVPQQRAAILHHVAMLPFVNDPVRAWQMWPLQLARQTGIPGKTYKVIRVNKIGSRLVEIIGTGAGDGKPPVTFIAYVYILPQIGGSGSWGMGSTFTEVPTSLWKRDGLTAVAILNSCRLNTQVFDEQNKQIRDAEQQQFDAEIASQQEQNAARRARTDAFLANDAVAQDEWHKDAVAMQNYALGDAVFRDTDTGEHFKGTADFAETMVHDNPNLQIVRPSELLQGVDY